MSGGNLEYEIIQRYSIIIFLAFHRYFNYLKVLRIKIKLSYLSNHIDNFILVLDHRTLNYIQRNQDNIQSFRLHILLHSFSFLSTSIFKALCLALSYNPCVLWEHFIFSPLFLPSYIFSTCGVFSLK